MKLKDLKFDTATGEFVREERIKINTAKDVKDMEDVINYELLKIVRQVKGLKRRAEELKAMKKALKKEIEPTGPISNSVVEEVQSPSAEIFDSK